MVTTAPGGELHPPPPDLAVFWFAYLDQAIQDGDYAAAAKAQAALSQLGITVRYRPQAALPVPGGDE